jgi:hypothetical protein
VDEAGKENNRKGCAIVLDENSNVVLEQRAITDDTAEESEPKNEQCNGDGKIESFVRSLTCEHLNTLLKIDEGNVEPEDVAGEPSYISKRIAGIGYGKYPMHHK